jgi:hypothetical protein
MVLTTRLSPESVPSSARLPWRRRSTMMRLICAGSDLPAVLEGRLQQTLPPRCEPPAVSGSGHAVEMIGHVADAGCA